MRYSIWRMSFSTPVHFGSCRGGKSLNQTEICLRSDTLFSALCLEAQKLGRLEELVGYAREGKLLLSDGLPWRRGEWYLPKPIVHLNPTGGTRQDGDRKAFSRLRYIPCNRFDEYLRGLSGANVDAAGMSVEFGLRQMTTRASISGLPETMPYDVEVFRFFPDCGLYCISECQDQSQEALLEVLLQNLGHTGVGGKKSSGLGKFSTSREPVPESLINSLSDVEAPFQMLLGTALPTAEEMGSALEDGFYSLIRRGGFVESESYSDRPAKKRVTYAFAAGSCLKKRFGGELTDVRLGGAHPVWRNGRTLFVGVRV